MTTVSSFSSGNPAARAASIPRSTAAWSSRRVSARKRSGRSVSRLTVTRWSPAARRAAAWSGGAPRWSSSRDRGPPAPRQQAHQLGHVSPQERLPPGQPHLVDPELGEDLDQALDLLEGQDVGPRGARRTPPPACSTGTGGCSGPSPTPGGSGAGGRACRGDRGRRACCHRASIMPHPGPPLASRARPRSGGASLRRCTGRRRRLLRGSGPVRFESVRALSLARPYVAMLVDRDRGPEPPPEASRRPPGSSA